SRPLPHNPTHRMAGDESHLPRLARPCRLRLRARARALARVRTSFIPRHINPLLVAAHPSLADELSLPRLVHAALPHPGGHRKHSPLRLPRILRPPRISLLSTTAKPIPHIAAIRPGR